MVVVEVYDKKLTITFIGNPQKLRCVCSSTLYKRFPIERSSLRIIILTFRSIQVNLAAETGEMGILANHVPSIEQLKPGLVEIIEESGSKQYFRESNDSRMLGNLVTDSSMQFPAASQLSSQTLN
jgi:hypothetical protein